MKLAYGQRFKCSVTGDEYELTKYWETDTDPNAYKVRLTNETRRKSFYSSDLRQLIKDGDYQLLT